MLVVDVAKRLNVSSSRVTELCRKKVLKAKKISSIWFISEDSVKKYEKTRQLPGRPSSKKKRENFLKGDIKEWHNMMTKNIHYYQDTLRG